jgi:hypothetical protein
MPADHVLGGLCAEIAFVNSGACDPSCRLASHPARLTDALRKPLLFELQAHFVGARVGEIGKARLGTLRDWEQGRVEPDQAARAYLIVIARNPKAVRERWGRR